MADAQHNLSDLESRIKRVEAAEEIRNLVAAYSAAAAARDEKRWVDQFAEDGVMDFSAIIDGMIISGHKALLQFFRERVAPSTATQQTSHNLYLEVKEGTASGTLVWTATIPLPDGQTQAGAGQYIDEYVRTSRGWKIHRRTIRRSA